MKEKGKQVRLRLIPQWVDVSKAKRVISIKACEMVIARPKNKFDDYNF